MNLIRSILDTHAAAGYRAITAREKDLYQVYLAARERIEDRIREYVLSGRSSFTGPRLVALMEELQDHFAAFEERYRKTTKQAISWVAQSFYHSALVDLGLNPPETSAGLERNALQQMVEDDFAHIAGATRKMSATAVGNLRRISARVMRETAMTGETRRALSKRLFAENGASFLFRARDGRIWDSGAYFKMLGRTMLHNNARETYLTACAENGSDLVTVSYSGAPCDACARWEGRLLSITGESSYPTIETATADGLFHPNCTHRLVAVPPAIAQTKFDADGKPKAGNMESPAKEAGDIQAPLFGNTPKGTKGLEKGASDPKLVKWFGNVSTNEELYRKLDREKVEVFLVYDREGNLFHASRHTASSGNLGKDIKNRVTDGFRFLHNHPPGGFPNDDIRRFGGSLSHKDIITAAEQGFGSMAATTRTRVYTIKPPVRGWPSSDTVKAALKESQAMADNRLAKCFRRSQFRNERRMILRIHLRNQIFAEMIGAKYLVTKRQLK
jgi:hypothetical protein